MIGSNSFSGSDFIDLLLKEKIYDIIGISRSPEKSEVFLPYKRHKGTNFKFVQLDMNKDMDKILSIADDFQPDYIVNFAAQSEVAPSWEHPDQWFQTNAVSITKLAHGLCGKKYLKKYVHISSPEVYGTCSGIVKEDAQLNPSTPYAASKAAGDLSLFTFFKNKQFPLVMVRSTNVYGAHQQLFKIIPRSVINIKSGKKIQLHGGGKAVKSYIHIRDISQGEKKIMEAGKTGSIYHLSPDNGIAVKDVVNKICVLMGVSFEDSTETVNERLGQDKAYIIDSSKARSGFGWYPEINIDSGLESVVGWVCNNWETIKSKPKKYTYIA